ncbi:amidohydrolase family protein [Pseudoalteromonas ruthenica]|uniref:amidohydrolase family protein n=1 Tax=Pseudoalteromonas ruthenica TaxID=151081 RepID=UPI00110BE988|nr:amidohydrolase family protein [Pseudoalteromonas ruthenica]TMO43093.1 hypothetical protein CWC24_16870 [Pseudoalteromonas ruthenica]TMO53066.1 hypothetical protein CWC23_00170 [Pseudoalteromonas ruthenica]
MSQRLFDPHVHLFDLSRGDYHWLRRKGPPFWPQKQAITRNFKQQDLHLKEPLQHCGAVHIEAGFDNAEPARELQWLAATGFTGAAISHAAIDLAPADFAEALAKLQHPLLRGIRDITEGADGARLLNPHCIDNAALLAEQGLLFEAQFTLADSQLCKRLIDLATAVPAINIVINHCGLVSVDGWSLWQDNLALLRSCDNILIKCSGWEMLYPHKSVQWQQQVIRCCINALGAERVMLASNFPLCLMQQSYHQVWQGYADMVLPQKHKLMHDNAWQLYRQP